MPPPQCPKCGQALPPDAPHGLCPVCLLQAGLVEVALSPPAAAETAALLPLAAFTNTPPATLPPWQAATGATAASVSPPGYEILAELGRGGMGVVYKARQIQLNRVVALKMILAGGHASAADLARFRTEAEAIARLQHPNIVQIHEVGEHEGKPFFSLEFCGGGSLTEKLNGTPLAPTAAARVVESLALAMDFAHKHGVIHRDLKPANVLLATEATEKKRGLSSVSSVSSVAGLFPKITDFGLAKKLDEAGQTQSGAIMGTPSYMAPEQAAGKGKEVGPAADVYALGAILYECLTGRPPFKAATPLDTVLQVISEEVVPATRLNAKVPRDLETICLKCLQKDPAKRYGSAEALAEDLRRWQANEPIAARPVGRLERGWRWCRRKPAAAAACLLGLFLLVGAIVVPLIMAFNEAHNAQQLGKEQGKTLTALELAKVNERTAKEAERQALRQAASSVLGRALALCDQGDVNRGLLLLARGLETARQAEAADLEEAFRWNLGAWAREVHELRQMMLHPAAVNAVAVSADGNLAASGCDDGKVRLWNLETGQAVGEPLVHPGRVHAVAFHPKDNKLLSGCEDGRARLWDVPSGRPVGPPLVHYFREKWTSKEWHPKHGVSCVAFSPDGKKFATGAGDNRVLVWDTASGKPAAPPMHHGGAIMCVAFSPDGRSVLYGCYGALYAVRDASTGQPIGRPWRDSDHGSIVFGIAISPDGKRVATGLNDQRLARQWDAVTGLPIGRTLLHQHHVFAVAYSPDGEFLVTGSQDRTARLWNVATERPCGALLQHAGAVMAVAFSPDGRQMLTGSSDGTVRVWSPGAGALLHALPQTPLSMVNCAAFSPDNRSVLIGCRVWGNRATLWDVVSGRQLLPDFAHTDNAGHGPNWVRGVAFSPGGSTVYTADRERQVVHFWDKATAQKKGATQPHGAGLERMVLSPDGRTLATSTLYSGVRLWNAETGHPIGEQIHRGAVLALAFSPDSKTLLTSGMDRTTRLWDASTGEPRAEPVVHRDQYLAVCFSPDGSTIVTGGEDGNAQRWNATSWKPVGPPMQHQGSVNSVVYTAGGRLILTSCQNGSAVLWHAATGLPVGPALRHESYVEFAVGSPDGRTLVTCGADAMARLWAVPVPAVGEPADIMRAVEQMTGLELDARDAFRLLAPADWQQRQAGGDRGTGRPFAAPNELALRLQAGRAFVRLKKWEQAYANFELALALKDNAYVRHERGMAYATQGRWEQAAADFTHALELQRDDHWLCYCALVLQAQLGKKEEYRRLCRDVLKHFGDTKDPYIAERTAKACLLLPDVMENPQKVSELADLAVASPPNHPALAWFCVAKGLAEYRAGRHTEAADWMNKTLARKPTMQASAMARFVLAMTQQQLGQLNESKVTLAQAQQITRKLPTLDQSGEGWLDWLINDLLRREAEALIAGKKPEPAK
jgi:WD40 repeat protein/tetratricopeptide (TPR) repeat protein